MLDSRKIKNLLERLREAIDSVNGSLDLLREDSMAHVRDNPFLLARISAVEEILSAKKVLEISIDEYASFNKVYVYRFKCLADIVKVAANNIVEYNSIGSSCIVEDMDLIFSEATLFIEEISKLL